ncbi:MAG: DUF5615 family PIN-like protein [bacterium]|nr:DUF5615 family PIN-like protein [bacterium]
MKFLIDENVPQWIIDYLQKDHQVIDVKKSKYHECSDHQLASLASKKEHIIITFDKDFLSVRNTISSFGCIFLAIRRLEKEFLIEYIKMILRDYQGTLRGKSFLIKGYEEHIIIKG